MKKRKKFKRSYRKGFYDGYGQALHDVKEGGEKQFGQLLLWHKNVLYPWAFPIPSHEDVRKNASNFFCSS